MNIATHEKERCSRDDTHIMESERMDKKKENLFECLWIWAGSGNVEALRAGLAKNPQLGRAAHKDNGETLLVHALKNRQSDCALALIPLSNAKRRSKGGELPLALAARCGFEACVEALIPLSAPVSAKDGLFALNAATEKGREEAARAILKAHPEWALASDPGGVTALMTALLWNEKGCARIIFPYSDQHAQERGGNSILQLAARMGFGDIVRQVISLDGARRRTVSGMTPLMAAATNGGENEDLAMDCVEALLPWSDIGHRSRRTEYWHKGLSAEDIARKGGLHRVAELISSFDAAQKERARLGRHIGEPKAPRSPASRL